MPPKYVEVASPFHPDKPILSHTFTDSEGSLCVSGFGKAKEEIERGYSFVSFILLTPELESALQSLCNLTAKNTRVRVEREMVLAALHEARIEVSHGHSNQS